MATIKATIQCDNWEDTNSQPLEFSSKNSLSIYLRNFWAVSSGIKFTINGQTFEPVYSEFKESYFFDIETNIKIMQSS